MAFFRTVSSNEALPSIAGAGVQLRVPQSGDYAEWAALREAEPRLPGALGADLAGRRSHPRRLPPAAQALRRGSAQRSRLRLPHLPQRRQCAGRRADARQYPPRRRASRLHRLLGRRAVRPQGLHDRGDARAGPVLFRHAAAASPGGGLHSGQCRLDPPAWRRPAFSARAMRAAISASTGYGRTTCSMRGSRTIRTAHDRGKKHGRVAFGLPRLVCYKVGLL